MLDRHDDLAALHDELNALEGANLFQLSSSSLPALFQRIGAHSRDVGELTGFERPDFVFCTEHPPLTSSPAHRSMRMEHGYEAEYPSNWNALDITRMADRLKGNLMIVSGTLDENVPSHQAFRLVDALTRANKPYDLLFLPNRTHARAGEGYTIKRTWDYFIEHLIGGDPIFDAVVTLACTVSHASQTAPT